MKINNETVCHKNKNTRVIIYSSKSSRGLRLPEDCPRNCPNKYFIILLKCEDRRKEIDHKIHFLLRRVLFKRNFPAVKLFYKLVFFLLKFFSSFFSYPDKNKKFLIRLKNLIPRSMFSIHFNLSKLTTTGLVCARKSAALHRMRRFY